MVEDLVGDAAFRASADFAGRLSLGGAALDVGEGRRVAAHARDRDAAERRVRPPVSTPVEAVPVLLPLDAGPGGRRRVRRRRLPEPPRVSRRLLTLRRWSHDEDLIEILA